MKPIPSDGPSLAVKVARGGLIFVGASYFNIFFGFLSNLFLIRFIRPDEYGVFALGLFFFSIMNIQARLGIDQALTRQGEITGELVGTRLSLDLAAGLLGLGLALCAWPILPRLGYPVGVAHVLLALAAAGLVGSLGTGPAALLDRDLQFSRTGLIRLAAFPLSYLPAFYLAYHGWGYWTLAVQFACNMVLVSAGMWWSLLKGMPGIFQFKWSFDKRIAVGLIRFGGLVGLAGLARSLLGHFDDFLVGTFVGAAALGFYDRAYRIAFWPNILVAGASNRIFFFTFARLAEKREELDAFAGLVLWITSAFGLPLALGIFLAAPELVEVLYGETWLPSVVFVRFLVVVSLVSPLTDIGGELLNALGEPRKSARIFWLQAGVLMLCGTPLTLLLGSAGTCIGVGTAFAFGLFLLFLAVRRYVSPRFRETVFPAFWAALATVPVVHGVSVLTPVAHWDAALRLFLKPAMTGLFFYGTILLFRPKWLTKRAARLVQLLRGVEK